MFKRLITAVALAASCQEFPVEADEVGRPNIILIFIDDMGYGDIGPYGNTVNRTPHLDRMAAEGIKFTDFYVSSTACTPSRAALMTGCYADRIGMDGRVNLPGSPRALSHDEITIAEMLKAEGYATGCFGKWHLGDAPEHLPLGHGFDEYEGIPYSNDMWVDGKTRDGGKWPPLPYIKGDKVVAHIPDGESQSLVCETFTRAAVDFIKRHKDEPFFAYVPHSYVHTPRFAREELRARADGDVTRAQIEEIDWSVGEILGALKELAIEKNTLVFFTSDNGGSGGTSMGPLRGHKSSFKYEGHMRVPALFWWPGRIPAGAVTSEIAATMDILPTLAALTGGRVPTDRVIDGKDVSSLLLKPGARSPHSELYYEYHGVRKGKWKLVYQNRKNIPELYDLEADLGESTDLYQQHPAKVKELDALLKAHKTRVQGARRAAGVVDNPKPLLKEPVKVPTLAEYFR